MATTPGGRQVADFSNSRLLLPSGGITAPERSAHGQVTIENGEVYIFIGGKWFSVGGLVEVPLTEAPPDSNLEVMGAGSSLCNGGYVNQDPDTWNGPLSVFVLKRIMDYPEPGAKSWAICQGAEVFYVAPDVPNPWDAVWSVGSFGSAPVPTVFATPVEPLVAGKGGKTASPSSADKKATANEEKKEQEFLAKQAKK
jgi:hypothetical protein